MRSYSIWFLLWFILFMVHPIVLFFIVYFVCVSCIIYDTLAVFVLWDREWMMPLRFIRSTNTVLFLIFFTLIFFCYRCFVCWYECASFWGFRIMVSLRYCMRGFFKCHFMCVRARLAFSVMMPVILQKCGWKGVFRVVFLLFL